ncbi:MAG: PA0069 family radical SAM protein [Proteobacteria bacterium]|nr:PA0069 family radical SAM protein [Pseudomonadota bacterium]
MRKGRGAVSSQASSRFERFTTHRVSDGWQRPPEEEVEDEKPLQTELRLDSSRSIIARNDSPDIGFSQSINTYRGCEHGCIYCYARPSHAYLGLSPGLDFESKIYHKPNAPELLRKELSKPSYKPELIVVGANTDVYQPVERKTQLTREVIKVLAEFSHPFTIITKSALILRDLDILAPLAERNLVCVAVTLGTLNPETHRVMEPRAPRPDKRLATMRGLASAGVPVTIMTAPIIPAINDHEIEDLLEAARDVGAKHAGFTILRLAWELKDLFEEWLRAHFPDRAEHVLSLLRQIYGGKLYDANWGVRGRGTGVYAKMLAQRHRLACDKFGLNKEERYLDHGQFKRPPADVRQMEMF